MFEHEHGVGTGKSWIERFEDTLVLWHPSVYFWTGFRTFGSYTGRVGSCPPLILDIRAYTQQTMCIYFLDLHHVVGC